MAAPKNDGGARVYGSGKVTPEQRGKFAPNTTDGAWASAFGANDDWGGVESDKGPSGYKGTAQETVENAHDQQDAPTYGLTGAVNSNATNRLAPPPTVDREGLLGPNDE